MPQPLRCAIVASISMHFVDSTPFPLVRRTADWSLKEACKVSEFTQQAAHDCCPNLSTYSAQSLALFLKRKKHRKTKR